jgi:hypothetical protein
VPDGVVWQTVVVVTGAVVGTVARVAGLVALPVVALGWVVAGAAGAVVGVVVVGELVAGRAVAATKPTSTAAAAPEDKKTVWVARRTRAKRRSRSSGVRIGDLMADSVPGPNKRARRPG